MSTTNWWGDWRPNLTPHTGNLLATDLIECTMIVGGLPVNTVITGAQILGAVPSGGGLTVGTTAIASGTIGRVLFQGTGNVLQQSANLFWDNTNSRLGIGGTPGAFNLDVNGTARVNGDLSVTTGAFKSIISSVTSQFTSYNPSNNYPRAQFQVGQNASDVNVGLTIAPLFSSTGVQKPTFIQVSTNKNTIDTGQFSAYFSVSTSLFTIGTNKQDGQVAGGVPIVFSPANTEALRINNNGNIGVNTTTNAGYRLDVNGTARVQNTLTVTSSSSNGALSLTQNSVGFAAQYIYRPNVTNAIASLMFQDLKSGANFKSFSLGIGRSGDPQWTNSDFIFGFYAGSGGWQQSAKIFNASGNWAIENGTGTSDIATAILQVNSTTKGFLPPRMTNAQMLAIATPAAGLVVYDTTNNKHCGYNGTAWQNFY